MIVPMTDAIEKEFIWSKEQLTKKSKMKNEGAGLLILGSGVLAVGALNHFLLHIMYESDIVWIVITAGCVISGIVMTVFGVKLMAKVGDSIAETTAKDSGYGVREIMEFYEECRQPETLLLSLTAQPSKTKDFDKVGFLTRNWLRLPNRLFEGVMRIGDVAVIWYEKTALPGYDPGIFVVKASGNLLYVKCKADAGAEIVKTIIGRNAKTITARCFACEGVDYDAFQNPQTAAGLYRQQC